MQNCHFLEAGFSWCSPIVLWIVIIGYMTKPNTQDIWWHERPTKATDARTAFQPLDTPQKRDEVWHIAALIVGLMFALTLALAAVPLAAALSR